MKIAIGIIIFNGDYVLNECLSSIYSSVDQILVAEGPVKFWQNQGFSTSTDKTNDILHNFPDPQNKIKIYHGQYSEKNEQCNAYIKGMNSDIDYIWNVDSDEIYKEEDIQKIFTLLDKYKITTMGFKSLTFYGGLNHYLTGFEEGAEFIRIRKVYPGSYWATHRPPTIAHPPNISIWPERHMDHNQTSDFGIRMYHYSYVFPSQVKNKIWYYENAVIHPGQCIPNYYDNIYKKWVLANDEEKLKIERQYEGVHEFTPNIRGECYTNKFAGNHPTIIEQNRNKIEQRIQNELSIY